MYDQWIRTESKDEGKGILNLNFAIRVYIQEIEEDVSCDVLADIGDSVVCISENKPKQECELIIESIASKLNMNTGGVTEMRITNISP